MIVLYSYGTRIKARPPNRVLSIDCLSIQNPHRPGRSEDAKREAVLHDPLFPKLILAVVDLAEQQAFAAAFCTWGRHRSVAVIDHAARELQVLGYAVMVIHLGRKMEYYLTPIPSSCGSTTPGPGRG